MSARIYPSLLAADFAHLAQGRRGHDAGTPGGLARNDKRVLLDRGQVGIALDHVRQLCRPECIQLLFSQVRGFAEEGVTVAYPGELIDEDLSARNLIDSDFTFLLRGVD